MRPVTLVQAGQGATPWLPVDFATAWFGVGLGLGFSYNSNLTASVQHTFRGAGLTSNSSDNGDTRQVIFTQTATTVTVTDTGPDGNGHRSVTGDSVTIAGTSQGIDGTYTITVTGVSTYTFTAAVSQSVTNPTQAYAVTQRVFIHSTLVNLTTRLDGYYAYPVRAIRLVVTAGTTGSAYLDVLQGLR